MVMGRERKEVGWINKKSLPRSEGSLHFFNPCNSFWCGLVVWANIFESTIIINFYGFFKYIWNCHWIRKAKPKAATQALLLLISSDMLDLFIPPRKKKINFGQLYTQEFTFVLQHSWKRLSCQCGMQKTIYQAFNKLQNIYVVQPIWNEMQR